MLSLFMTLQIKFLQDLVIYWVKSMAKIAKIIIT
jgi:hypothetical protein